MRVFWNEGYGPVTLESLELTRAGSSVFDHERGIELVDLVWADDETGEYAQLVRRPDGTRAIELRKGRLTFTFPAGRAPPPTIPATTG